MIEVTQEAKELLQTVELPGEQVLRLDPVQESEDSQPQIGLVAGEPMPDDEIVEHEGQQLLHISSSVSQALDGGMLEKVDTPEGAGLKITPPEEQENSLS